MLIHQNNASRIKRYLGAEMVRLYRTGKMISEVDVLSVNFIPRFMDSYRCCIYKDRAMIRYMLITLMGFAAEDDDEVRSLSSYAEEACTHREIEMPVMSVINMACSSCTGGTHCITDLCKGCVARPCIHTCPKNAISFEHGEHQS